MSSLPSRIAILGPTASGKSALGAEVARRLGGIVVNGDPFQAYEGLAIGTGQPTAEEQGEIGHVGYGLLSLSTTLNPASFGAQVRAWMGEGPAVLVTGSGLYLRGIWEQLDVLPEVDEALVARTRRWGQTMPGASLHRYLCAVDPLRAQQLHPKDRSRLQRALALHLATGKRPSELLRGVERGLPEGWKALVVRPSRESIRERIARRVRAMVEAGWPDEVRRLVEAGWEGELRRLRPLGYEEWLAGGDAAEIEARIVQRTQAYAKRQTTFFGQQWPALPTWNPDAESLAVALERLGL